MPALNSSMMTMPLLISGLLQRAARYHGTREIVSRVGQTGHSYTYRESEIRAKRLAKALMRMGIARGDRVATLAWNDYRHFELYYAIPGMGAICHTVNPRLFLEQLQYIIRDGGCRVVFLDPEFLPLAEKLSSSCPNVESWIVLADAGSNFRLGERELQCYEEILAAEDDNYEWPMFEEQSPSNLCYTSGTTGNPKGVLYSHRSSVLHAYACALPDAQNITARDVVMPVVPLFHANAWEIPYSVPLVGAKLVLPGSYLDGQSLYGVIEEEGVTLSVGVPTVWQNLLRYVRSKGLRFTTLRRLLVGGSTMPASDIVAFAELGVQVSQGWGMTETAALTTCTAPLTSHAQLSDNERQKRVYENQGRIVAGAEMRIVDSNGKELPWDGDASGHLQVRAHWVTERYFGERESALKNGWLPTGDIARISADGFMQITDRDKDVIKSGGEWISSIEIENIATSHPDLLQAACIACTHEKWGERPLLVVVPRPNSAISAEDVLQFFEGRVATWAKPDDVVFVDELPTTATGKLAKLKLREKFKDYLIKADK